MTIGWDTAELLKEIEARDEQIRRLVPGSFTESEAKLAIDAMRNVYMSDRIGREVQADAAVVIQKLQVVLDRFADRRRLDTEFAASLTKEERQLILDERARRRGP